MFSNLTLTNPTEFELNTSHETENTASYFETNVSPNKYNLTFWPQGGLCNLSLTNRTKFHFYTFDGTKNITSYFSKTLIFLF